MRLFRSFMFFLRWEIAARLGVPRLRSVVRWLVSLVLLLGVAGAGTVGWYFIDLPDVSGLGKNSRRPGVTMLASDGVTVIAQLGDLYGRPVRIEEIPAYLPQAVVAIEDRRFYSHGGVDYRGLARAFWANLRAGRIVQGGSTITQQLAKNLFLTPVRTIKRKVQEVMLAWWLEQNFTKDEILTIYLNRVYLGGGAYGVEAAAQRYLGKSARDLDLSESAMIAGLLQAPSRYAPSSDLARARARAGDVLDAMVENGFITPGEARGARRQPVMIVPPRRLETASARYFADWLLEQVSDYAGPEASDFVVITTLDVNLQRAAEEAVAWALEGEGRQRGARQAALVAMAPNGAVLAMVGGSDYQESQFNRATQALRQPGSAFKLFVYLAALEAGFRPTDLIDDAPVTVDGWSPKNYDDTYAGPVTLRTALARSINSVAVRLSERVGRKAVLQMAHRLGVTTPLRGHPSLALGASEMTLIELTAAYGTLANQGRGVWPYGIVEIRSTSGQVLYRREGSGPGEVIDQRTLADMTAMLGAVVDEGTGRAAALRWPVAGKTGTSQDWRDAWFIGFTRDLVAGVWVGNDDNTPMQTVTGGGMPARLWARFMEPALAGYSPAPLIDFSGGAGFIGTLLDSLLGIGEPAGDATWQERSSGTSGTPTPEEPAGR
jgi:penicillin-binding protein 1A